ncbi:MAG TPA: DAK2 domain-containing protein [Dehalococcoidia bacterium]|nr:DAK2 domain-containing protein [Dehalococcoidia bacterium]
MTTAGPGSLTASALHEILRTAERWLELHREPINAINVYPVPDGDTGTNMVLTLRAALDAGDNVDGAAGTYMQAIARAALLGARGNSGVILSQIVRGVSDAVGDADVIDGPLLQTALTAGAQAAYGAVTEPVEGTMLTVIREAAEAAASGAGDSNLVNIISAAASEAEASVERTPSLLPTLAEAGVVDSGGLGVAVLLAGISYAVRGESLPEPKQYTAADVDMTGVEHEGHGYCAEFVVVGAQLDRGALHAALDAVGGESLLVVGYDDALHVHVHVDDPGPTLSVGAAAGSLQSVKIDDMQSQHDQWSSAEQPQDAADLPSIGLLAVTQGDGIAAAFRELGATAIVDGGPTSNPSAGELLAAARQAGRDHVIVLPNDANVIMAAEQAAAEAPDLITVIPTRSVAGGFGAAFAYEPEGERDAVAAAMSDAIEGVSCVEVTHSVRDTSVNGIQIARGDAIAIVEGTLVARAESLEEALMDGLSRVAGDAELATVYLGSDAPADARDRVAMLISETYDEIEIEIVHGGQPHYPYILGVE